MTNLNLYQVLLISSIFATCYGWDLAPRVKRSFLTAPITQEGLTAKEEIAHALEKKEAYEQFKSAVVPKIKADWMKKEVILVKYFNAAQRDPSEAIALVEGALAWRKDHSIDGILDEDFKEQLALFGNAGIKGKDLSGRIITYLYHGKWRLTEAIKKGEEVQYERAMQYLAENGAVEIVKNYEAGAHNSKAISIVDFENWKLEDGLCTQCTNVMVRITSIFDQKYPHQAHKWICINVPLDFSLFLNLIRVVLSKETNENVLEYGRDKHEWKKELLKIIDPKTLKEMMYIQDGYD